MCIATDKEHRLETHAETAKRIAVGKSTLSAMRKPGHPRFDPTFPEAIPVGPPSNPYASIRFNANEVGEWIESRMQSRRGKSQQLHYPDQSEESRLPKK